MTDTFPTQSVATLACILLAASSALPQSKPTYHSRVVNIGRGWARNQINAVIFRRNSVTTHRDYQYVAFYDENSNVVMAKRRLGSEKWITHKTQYRGNTRDAHNSISIAVDGKGFLHVAWNHHASPLHYSRGRSPGSLELSREMSMVGDKESRVTYPEFYNLPAGNLLLLYRDGVSGSGNLVINRYDVTKSEWMRVHDNLINGEGERNAYWQAAVDSKGTIHVSWVWRETSDVATNHDMCYAKSLDGGATWQKSTGERYQLPITAKSAEYALRIPQGSELINQTSMCADSAGRPYIATYWRPQGTTVPQYHLIYKDGREWRTYQVTHRTSPFTLSGGGTKRIPISRPLVVADSTKGRNRIILVFRDSERGSRVSIAINEDPEHEKWSITDLTEFSVGMWEPTYDQALWDSKGEIHVLVQNVGQGDGETLEDLGAQMVSILQCRP